MTCKVHMHVGAGEEGELREAPRLLPVQDLTVLPFTVRI